MTQNLKLLRLLWMMESLSNCPTAMNLLMDGYFMIQSPVNDARPKNFAAWHAPFRGSRIWVFGPGP